MDETNSERSIVEAKCVLEEIEKAVKESGKFDAETEREEDQGYKDENRKS